MNECRDLKYYRRQRMWMGIALLVVGVLMFIDNMHLLYEREVFSFWPTVMIIGGVFKIVHRRDSRGWIIGLCLIGFGIGLTLQFLGVIALRQRDWWPIFLIFLGLQFTLRRDSDHRDFERRWRSAFFTPRQLPPEVNASAATSAGPAGINATAILSGSQFNFGGEVFQGGQMTAIMGGVEANLREARLDNDVVLDVFVLMGGIVLKVPSDWAIVNQVTVLAGGVEEKCVPPAAATRRLIIRGSVMLGGVEIKN